MKLKMLLEVIEMDWAIFLTFMIPLIIIIIIGLICIIVLIIQEKIHSSFHKGIREARNNNLEYYKVLKKITDDFSKILLNFDNESIRPSIITTQLLLDFKSSLKKYHSK